MEEKILYPKSKHALYTSLTGLIVLISVLFAKIKWVFISGIFIGFFMSILAMVFALQALKFVNKNKEKYRGDNMAWIAFILAVLMFLMSLPFVIEFTGTFLA